MAWTNPPDFVAGAVVTEIQLDTLSNDLTYLFSSRPGSAVKRDNGANYTTTSTSFTDIDGTNLAITLSVNSGKVLLFFCGSVISDGGTSHSFDFTIDGTRYASAGTDGLMPFTGINKLPFAMSAFVTGLSVASHTFKVQWKAQSAQTLTLHSGNGVGGTDFIPTFIAVEVG